MEQGHVLGLLDSLKFALRDKHKSAVWADGEPGIASSELDHSNIISFVWLRNKPQSKDDLSDPMPQRHGNNVSETARRNPDCSVVLWVDEGHWNHAAREKLTGLCSHEDLPNLSLRSLREIPEYRTNMLFAKEHKRFRGDHTDPIWQKVDFARVMVLNHLLKTTEARQVFYADVDLVAPPISSPEIQDVMQQHGMVFARDNRTSSFLENQFMGFGRENADFVTYQLVPMTLNAISNGMDGWQPMCHAAHTKVGNGPGWLDNITVRTIEID